MLIEVDFYNPQFDWPERPWIEFTIVNCKFRKSLTPLIITDLQILYLLPHLHYSSDCNHRKSPGTFTTTTGVVLHTLSAEFENPAILSQLPDSHSFQILFHLLPSRAFSILPISSLTSCHNSEPDFALPSCTSATVTHMILMWMSHCWNQIAEFSLQLSLIAP